MPKELRLSFSQKLVLSGMVGLALLSGTHQLRETLPAPERLVRYVLDIMPNFAAAIALPLVLAGLVPRIAGARETGKARRDFGGLLAFTTSGLVAWEFLQRGSRTLVFDVHDLIATVVGAATAFLAFATLLAQREAPKDTL